MTCTLKAPIYYLEGLILSREYHGDKKYTKEWMIELTRHTNRHLALDGKPWGWYQVNNCNVGYWDSNSDDILSSGIDLVAWKREAKRLSLLSKKDARALIQHHKHNREPSVHEKLNSIWK